MKLLIWKDKGKVNTLYDENLKTVRNKKIKWVVKRVRDLELLFIDKDVEMTKNRKSEK